MDESRHETLCRCLNMYSRKFKGAYHFEQQHRSREVGVLFEVLDHSGLNNLTTTLHDQTGGGNGGQLVGLHIPQAPSQDLGTKKDKITQSEKPIKGHG